MIIQIGSVTKSFGGLVFRKIYLKTDRSFIFADLSVPSSISAKI